MEVDEKGLFSDVYRDTPTAGRYRLDGLDVSGLARDERAAIRNARLGFVFQNFNLCRAHTRRLAHSVISA